MSPCDHIYFIGVILKWSAFFMICHDYWFTKTKDVDKCGIFASDIWQESHMYLCMFVKSKDILQCKWRYTFNSPIGTKIKIEVIIIITVSEYITSLNKGYVTCHPIFTLIFKYVIRCGCLCKFLRQIKYYIWSLKGRQKKI